MPASGKVRRGASLSHPVRSRYAVEPLEARRLLAAIASDQTVIGSIQSVGEVDEYTFSADAGESVVIAVTDPAVAGFWPRIRLIGPNAAQVATDSGSNGARIVANNLTQTGTFTILVDDLNNSPGQYRLTMAKVDGPQSPNDGHGGEIRSGERKIATIGFGDIDVYTFTSAGNETAIVTMAETTLGSNIWPEFRVYGPTGTQIITGSDSNGDRALVNAAVAGTYYIVAYDSFGYYSGEYALALSKAPGPVFDDATDTERSTIRSGERLGGQLLPADMDIYTFQSPGNENVIVSMSENVLGSNIWPEFRVYGPAGTQVASGSSSNGDRAVFAAAAAGAYTIVAYDSFGYYTGDYTIALSQSTGVVTDDATDLEPRQIRSGERLIAEFQPGDQDVYTFDSTGNESVIVSISETTLGSNIWPEFRVYGPTGAQVATGSGSSGDRAAFTASAAGSYRVVAYDSFGYYTGEYAIAMSKSSGTIHDDSTDVDGAHLAGGAQITGSVTAGDQDIHTFTGTAGVSVTIRMNELAASNIWPEFRVYGPTGAQVGSGSGSASAVSTFTPTVSGTYRVVVYDSFGYYSDNYGLSLDAAAVTADAAAPQLVGARFGYERADHALFIQFSENIQGLDVSDVTITHLGTNTPIAAAGTSIQFNPSSNRAALTFPGVPDGRLADGRYRATFSNMSVTDTAGHALTNTGFTFDFHVFAGDVNYDGRIDIADLLPLSTYFERTSLQYLQGDYNFDGTADSHDLTIIAAKWQTTVDGASLGGAAMPAVGTTAQAPPPPPASARKSVREVFRPANILT